MDIKVIHTVTAPPVERVVLDLPVKEFRVLVAIASRIGGSSYGPRAVVQKIFDTAVAHDLAYDLTKFLGAEKFAGSVYLTDQWPEGK